MIPRLSASNFVAIISTLETKSKQIFILQATRKVEQKSWTWKSSWNKIQIFKNMSIGLDEKIG